MGGSGAQFSQPGQANNIPFQPSDINPAPTGTLGVSGVAPTGANGAVNLGGQAPVSQPLSSKIQQALFGTAQQMAQQPGQSPTSLQYVTQKVQPLAFGNPAPAAQQSMFVPTVSRH